LYFIFYLYFKSLFVLDLALFLSKIFIMHESFDIIVVGAGHAGCEAASAAANLGSKVLLLSMDMTKFGQMSCNPAIGGIAKGQIVREIDAMGGYTGIVTDNTMIQFRMLNRSKGPAMWSPRAQCDRTRFTLEWRKILESNLNISFWQDVAVSLLLEGNRVVGVKTQLGIKFYSKAVVITSGTFQNGLIHVGRNKVEGGRISEPPSKGISDQLSDFGFEVGRMKTGTPARIDGRTVDFSVMAEQHSDPSGRFSYLSNEAENSPKMSCFITYTNEEVHRILETGFKDSPLYTGIIKGVGPRYCPSIEDKIVTFHDKLSHQLFLEPEGVDTHEFYLNGFSSSLPWDIQYRALRKIKGLENVKIFRPGYAIEYDYYPPTQLKHTLETKHVENLFFAGQINGTTGYEEAAAQGLMAGINANLKISEKESFILKRDEAYTGVLIDDLVTKGVDEPYRMFTSRAEYRILLRQDNADERLTEKSYNIGLATKQRYDVLQRKLKLKSEILNYLSTTSIKPEEINSYLVEKGTSEISQSVKLRDLISRPQIDLNDLFANFAILKQVNLDNNSTIDAEILESVDIFIKYNGYVEREKQNAEKSKRLEDIIIPNGFDFSKISSLSIEARSKLTKVRPTSIGQAARISGVSPSDINVLLVFIGR
jgi:tRNA uridine 5-carboxymethylaminomethyl modification enzyme